MHMLGLIGLLPLAHGLPLLAYLLLRGSVTNAVPEPFPDRVWWQLYNFVTLLNEFTPWFFLPLPLWLLTLLIARRPSALLATALPWAMFLALYGELFVPRPAHVANALQPPPAPESRLRVMTFNVLALRRPMDEIVQIIEEADPDVLMAQELLPSIAQAIDDAHGDRLTFSRLRTDGGWGAQGIWSRYPIVGEERWDGSRRGAQWQHAVLDVNGRQVHLVNLHLSTPTVRWRSPEALPVPVIVGEVSEARQLEVAWLAPRLRQLAASPNPVLVAGDLNLTDQTPEFRRLLDAGYDNAYRQAGWGINLTFPALPRARLMGRTYLVRFPVVGIDHMLVSSELQARRARVWPESGRSDHFPVVADLVLRPPE
jgi:endonuclease/exonuclease/phosphatase family metal-dependent hydrolase